MILRKNKLLSLQLRQPSGSIYNKLFTYPGHETRLEHVYGFCTISLEFILPILYTLFLSLSFGYQVKYNSQFDQKYVHPL